MRKQSLVVAMALLLVLSACASAQEGQGEVVQLPEDRTPIYVVPVGHRGRSSFGHAPCPATRSRPRLRRLTT